MNYALRVYRDGRPKSPEVNGQLEDTIRLFLPVLECVDTSLSRLPEVPKSLYRGIEGDINATMYTPGSMVPWPMLSSTSSNFKEANRSVP